MEEDDLVPEETSALKAYTEAPRLLEGFGPSNAFKPTYSAGLPQSPQRPPPSDLPPGGLPEPADLPAGGLPAPADLPQGPAPEQRRYDLSRGVDRYGRVLQKDPTNTRYVELPEPTPAERDDLAQQNEYGVGSRYWRDQEPLGGFDLDDPAQKKLYDRAMHEATQEYRLADEKSGIRLPQAHAKDPMQYLGQKIAGGLPSQAQQPDKAQQAQQVASFRPSQAEKARMQQLLNGLSNVRKQLASGQIDPQTAGRFQSLIQAELQPLQERQAKADQFDHQTALEQMRETAHHGSATQHAVQHQNDVFDAKNIKDKSFEVEMEDGGKLKAAIINGKREWLGETPKEYHARKKEGSKADADEEKANKATEATWDKTDISAKAYASKQVADAHKRVKELIDQLPLEMKADKRTQAANNIRQNASIQGLLDYERYYKEHMAAHKMPLDKDELPHRKEAAATTKPTPIPPGPTKAPGIPASVEPGPTETPKPDLAAERDQRFESSRKIIDSHPDLPPERKQTLKLTVGNLEQMFKQYGSLDKMPPEVRAAAIQHLETLKAVPPLVRKLPQPLKPEERTLPEHRTPAPAPSLVQDILQRAIGR